MTQSSLYQTNNSTSLGDKIFGIAMIATGIFTPIMFATEEIYGANNRFTLTDTVVKEVKIVKDYIETGGNGIEIKGKMIRVDKYERCLISMDSYFQNLPLEFLEGARLKSLTYKKAYFTSLASCDTLENVVFDNGNTEEK